MRSEPPSSPVDHALTTAERPSAGAPLPAPRTSLVGRERELALVRDLLLRPDVRLVTLTGPGGVGKTSLALRLAIDLAPAFAGVAQVPLAAIRDPDLLLPAVAQTLGVREAANVPALETLAAALAGRRWLLVLDNLEQVPAALPVAALLVSCPDLTLLATSREVLRVSGERDVPLPPLALPDASTSVDALGAIDAVRLFVERAQAVRPEFALDAANAPAVAEICRRLDGLPLALELAAARLRHLTPQALLARLDKRLPILTGGARDQPLRLRALRDTIGWSYDLLSPEEQRLFRRLALFEGGFSLDAAEFVAGGNGGGKGDEEGEGVSRSGGEASLPPHPLTRLPSPLDGIASLVDKSLLRHEAGPGGEPRYRMLETIREYGLERLAAAGEDEAARRAHAACFLNLAERGGPGVLTAEQASWLALLDRDHDNLRAALAWYLERDDAANALRFAGALAFYWYYRGHLAEGRQALERALAVAARAGMGAPAERAWALTGVGLLASVQGDLPAAVARLREGLALWGPDAAGWAPAVTRALLGGVLVGQGRFDEAAGLFAESIDRFAELGNQAWVAHARFHLGAIAFAQGDRARARMELHDAAERYDAIGGRLDAIDPRRYLGLLACAGGDLAGAAALFAGNLDRLRERGSRSAIANGLVDVATLAARRGTDREAARLFGAAEAILRVERATLSLPARTVYEAAMAGVRAALGEAEYEAERVAGAAFGLDAAVKLAVELVEAPVTAGAASAPSAALLTEREVEVLRLLAAGRTNPEIADALFIGTGTARNHVSHILAKLGARTRTEAADLARRRGIL